MKRLSYSILMIVLSFALSLNAFSEKITILHVNDSHSNLSSGGNRDQSLQGSIGGIARVVSYVGMEKMQDPSAIFLHGGDFSINDLFYIKYFGVPELAILKQLGCTALELGNHEFDLTPYGLASALKGAEALGGYPQLLCANADFSDASDSNIVYLSQVVKKCTTWTTNNVKIGMFGMITPSTAMTSQPGKVNIPTDPTVLMSTAAKMVDSLKSSLGCQVVMMLSHLGSQLDYLVADNVPGINLIVGAHDHYLFNTPIKVTHGTDTTYILQAGAFYRQVGKAVLDVTGNSVTMDSYTMTTMDANIPEEPTTLAQVNQLIAGIEQTYGPMFTHQIATVTADYSEMAINLGAEGAHDVAVSDWVADVYKAWGGTDIGLIACGSTAQPLYKGPIVGEDIFRVIGYGFNTVNGLGFQMAKFEIKGSDIAKAVQFGLDNIAFGDDFVNVGDRGFTYTYDAYIDLYHPETNHGTLKELKIGGMPIDTSKYYSVTTNTMLLTFAQMNNYDIKNIQVNQDTTEFMVLYGAASLMQNLTPYTDARIYCGTSTSVKDNIENIFAIGSENFPNPCQSQTTLKLNINNPGNYTLYIFNSNGICVKKLDLGYLVYGINQQSVATHDLLNGVYNYSLFNGKSLVNGRFMVVK